MSSPCLEKKDCFRTLYIKNTSFNNKREMSKEGKFWTLRARNQRWLQRRLKSESDERDVVISSTWFESEIMLRAARVAQIAFSNAIICQKKEITNDINATSRYEEFQRFFFRKWVRLFNSTLSSRVESLV